MNRITSLLIANRGEIAIRIIATCRKLGIKTYVIKTDKEPDALYLSFADEIIDFTNDINVISEFLNIEKIIEAAKANKVMAIHPGYGFLAESALFALRCEEEGIIFVGPNARAIHKMGNKTIAKQMASNINVPFVKGSKDNVSTAEDALAIANEIGYPVILKAAAGGGGKGMRIVESEADMAKMYKLATNEALNAFNDTAMLVEQYVQNPKHIEFQIVADKHGNVIHIGERECSVQRKHQKLIEEAPSPALNDDLRSRMGAEAIKIAREVAYDSVGTVEFLLDDAGNFYFMEMNTRIQVEHPVTEEISGLDLVELMIRIADGEELPLSQDDVQLQRWAIECRITAEDIQNNFAPNTGLIERLSFPKGENIRIETGVQSGSNISSHFDSMIAKLIVTGENRSQAIDNMREALQNIKVKGLRTTIPFHKVVLQNRKFISGNYTTAFVEKDLDKMYDTDEDKEAVAAFVAAFEYAREVQKHLETEVDVSQPSAINTWVLHNRLKS